MSVFEAVAVPRLYRIIANQIAGKIRDGEFQVGGRLPSERELAEQLGVSRASVREALIALELEGYVSVRVGTGVFVLSDHHPDETRQKGHGPSKADYENDLGPFDLLETRLLLEPESAALAAERATDAQIQDIREAQAEMAGNPNPSLADHAFHMAVAVASGNAALVAVIDHIWSLALNSAVFSRMDKHFVDARVWDKADKEHMRILEAIVARDAVRARSAMHDHLVEILERLRVDFGSDGAL